jgi:protein-disulfide isomerase
MENKNNLGAIVAVAAVILLGVGVYLYGGTGTPRNLFAGDGKSFFNLGDDGSKTADSNKGQTISPITATDHIRGDVTKAKIAVVEYSDLECPFCKRFHETMNQVMSEYQGQVVWVYRHFPLESLHSKAKHEAVAAECAATLGGNDKFWQYIDRVFEVTPSNDGLDPSLLSTLATEVGLDKTAFATCLAKNDLTKIEAQIAEAEANGAEGTPFPIIIGVDGTKTALPGALPFSDLKKLLDAELAKAK